MTPDLSTTDLRDADGRRRLQPVLEAAARRLGDMPGGGAAQGGAVGGAFAANWDHRCGRPAMFFEFSAAFHLKTLAFSV